MLAGHQYVHRRTRMCGVNAYKCMLVCTCKGLHVWVYACGYTRVHVRAHMPVQECMHGCVHTSEWVSTQVPTLLVHACASTWAPAYGYMCTYL